MATQKEQNQERSDPNMPSDADFTSPSPMTMRLAVGPGGAHGYEIGYWQANADPTDPRHFVVIEGNYDQVEAAQRVNVLNAEWMAGQVTPQQLRQRNAEAVKAKADAEAKAVAAEHKSEHKAERTR